MTSICVLGLGYIGLPTAAMFATHGYRVHGYDVNADIVSRLSKGETHIEEPGLKAFVRDAVHSGKLVPSDRVVASDVYILCVPSPVDHATHEADLSYVVQAAEGIVPHLKKGDLVILETTVPARTTEDVLIPVLAKSGLDPRRDLKVVHCPETVLPGNMIYELAHNHRVIGGVTEEATRAARDLYACFVKAEFIETDATTAEFVKLAENAYRDVNIALANELALVCRKLGIDSREALRIARKHPRVHLHEPGPGVGGHCIPVDPWFIIQQLPTSKVLRAARDVNDAMPAHVVSLVEEAVHGLPSPTIAVLGLAYKGNIDDARESPAIAVVELLKKRWPDAVLRLHDPYVRKAGFPTVDLDTALHQADCVLVLTDHAAYRGLDPRRMKDAVRRRVVVDTRAMLEPRQWINSGFWVLRV